MAYGVKYRLIFSDLLGNGKKVEILQDGYSGEVLPMIGTGDPVQIQWEGDDDFYEPIIGSSCTINLLVTDDVSYDDFFRGNEEEYRVQVFYDRSVAENFQDRVEAYQTNAGYFESPECIENQLSSGNTIQSDFTKRVLNDGGTIDNDTCIAKSITNSKTYDWQTLWEGFLYLDNYSEALATTPYEISITALDGLGLLDVKDSPRLGDPFPNLSSNAFGESFWVALFMQEFNKDITANIERYLHWAGFEQYTGETDFFGDDIPARPWIPYSNMDSDNNYLNQKEVLENILRKTNSRIFHAFGDWYVVPNSIYLDDVFSSQYYDRSVFKNALSKGQNEIIKFQTFGVGNNRDYLGDSTRNVTRRMRKDIQPLGNDLSIEYLSPLNKVTLNTDLFKLSDLRSLYTTQNVGFTFGSDGYTLNYGSIGFNDYVSSNTRSYRVTNYVTSSASRAQMMDVGTVRYNNWAAWGADSKGATLSFNFLFDSTSTSPNYTFYYSLKNEYGFSGFRQIRYYDEANKTWGTSIVYNEVTFTEASELLSWQKKNVNITEIGTVDADVELIFYLPYVSFSSGYNALYLDNIYMKSNDFDSKERTITGTISQNRGKYELETIPNDEIFNSFFTPLLQKEFNMTDSDIVQQILNDYRSYVPRYEGTGYGLKKKPVTPIDKLYMDFDNFKEDQASMIDTLKYNLRRNEAEFVAHTPNNDPDVAVTEQIKEISE